MAEYERCGSAFPVTERPDFYRDERERKRRAAEAGPEARFSARFDGAVAWSRLTTEQQAAIGAIALEIVVNWNGQEAYDDFAQTRPFDAGDPILLDALHDAVATAIADVIAADPLPVPSLIGGVCRMCGCTQNDACDVGCGWAQGDLCTACAAGGEPGHG